MVGADDADRRGRLRALKLAALVRHHLGSDRDLELGSFPPGAALTTGGDAWVLAEDEPQRSLGPAIAWARQRDAKAVNVLTERDSGMLARRAAAFARPPLRIWHVDGRELRAATSEPLPEPERARAEHLALIETIRSGGASPVVEHGVVTGEVRGLEVCRVSDDPNTGDVRLEVGVGVHDREAFAMLHGDIPTVEALRGVVSAVEAHRHPDAPQHPLKWLAQERLLRWQLTQQPDAVDLCELVEAEPPVPRLTDLRRPVPCIARGRDADGDDALVVCSVGVDLDVIPFTTDARVAAARTAHGSCAELTTMVVTPARDRIPVTEDLAASLVHPVLLASPT